MPVAGACSALPPVGAERPPESLVVDCSGDVPAGCRVLESALEPPVLPEVVAGPSELALAGADRPAALPSGVTPTAESARAAARGRPASNTRSSNRKRIQPIVTTPLSSDKPENYVHNKLMPIKLPRLRWRYLLYPVAGLAVANIAYQFAISWYQLGYFRQADPVLLLLALANQLVAYTVVVPAMRGFYARAGIHMSDWRTFGLVASALGLGKLLPGGEYILWRTFFHRRKGGVTATTQWMIMYGVWMVGGLVLLFFGFEMATLAFYSNAAATTVVGKLRYLPVILTLGFMVGLLFAKWEWVRRVLSRVAFDKLGSRSVSPMGIIRDRKLGQNELGALTFTGLAYWLVEALTMYFCLAAIGIRVPLVIAIFGYTFARLFELLPLVPGGIGVIEAGAVVFFVAYGYHVRPVFAAAVLFRLLTFWPPVMIGAISYAGLKKGSGKGAWNDGRLELAAELNK